MLNICPAIIVVIDVGFLCSSNDYSVKIGFIHTQVDHVTLVKIRLDGFEVGHQGSWKKFLLGFCRKQSMGEPVFG